MRKSVAIFVILFFPLSVFAHPGRTDSSGCHTCRTNCAKWGLGSGEYHCHQAKALPQPKEPIKSHFSESGGYTTPAPEYKLKQEVKPAEGVGIKVDVPLVEKIAAVKNVDLQIQEKQAKKKESFVVRAWRYLFGE